MEWSWKVVEGVNSFIGKERREREEGRVVSRELIDLENSLYFMLEREHGG